jgi:hypothetical protein
MQKHRTASFTQLNLIGSDIERIVISDFVRWPAILTHFVFKAFDYNSPVLDHPMFESWLLIHKDTLIHIHINCIRRQDSDHLFNATLFPRLEFLQLRRGPIHSSAQDYGDEHMKLLGHNLKTFC